MKCAGVKERTLKCTLTYQWLCLANANTSSASAVASSHQRAVHRDVHRGCCTASRGAIGRRGHCSRAPKSCLLLNSSRATVHSETFCKAIAVPKISHA